MRVILEPVKHIYKDTKGQTYKSVSSIIELYKHPFNAHKVMPNGKTLLQNYVTKNGESEQYWLKVWEEKKDYACEKGTAFHDLKEIVLNNQAVHCTGRMELPVQNVNKLWQLPNYEGNFNLLPPGVYTELTLWNYMHRIAGTADVVIIYPDRTFEIADYKTNGEFKTSGFQGRCMKYPCINLPDCHLGHYTLQLSLYAWMLIQFGLTPRNLTLLHYAIPDSEVIAIVKHGILPDIDPTLYSVAYAEQEVTWVMKDRLMELKRMRR